MKEPTVVIDSNILVSILRGKSSLSLLYTAFKDGRFTLVISSEILKELAAVLYRPHLKINSKDIKELFRLIKARAVRVKSPALAINECRDPKDNFLLELAVGAKADFIVTGDKDLLVLNPFRNVSIVPPREFLDFLKSERIT